MIDEEFTGDDNGISLRPFPTVGAGQSDTGLKPRVSPKNMSSNNSGSLRKLFARGSVTDSANDIEQGMNPLLVTQRRPTFMNTIIERQSEISETESHRDTVASSEFEHSSSQQMEEVGALLVYYITMLIWIFCDRTITLVV